MLNNASAVGGLCPEMRLSHALQPVVVSVPRSLAVAAHSVTARAQEPAGRAGTERHLDDNALMQLAFAAAQNSPNRIRKVGAAILACDDGGPIAACNTFPKGVADLDERHEGDGRFVWMEHAERNAIFTAARAGRGLSGGRLASTLFPCIDCARAIVISGIATLVTYPPPLDDPVWGASFPRSRIILEEGGVRIVFLERSAA